MVSGWVPIPVIVQCVALASTELFNHFLGRSDERKPGPHVGLNTRSTQALAPFTRRQEYRAVPANPSESLLVDGQFTLPADCAYVDYYDMPGAQTVRQVEGHALRQARFDPVSGPTSAFPLVTTVENGEKQIYPATVTKAAVQYFARPPRPTYVETYAADGTAMYDDLSSVDVGWGREHEPDLLQRTLRYVAQAIKDGMLTQTANGLTQENS